MSSSPFSSHVRLAMRSYCGVLRTVSLARMKDFVSQPDERAINLLIDRATLSEADPASMTVYQVPLTLGDSPRPLGESF